VTLTAAGTPPFRWRVDPRSAYEQALAAASAIVQDHATAHSEITIATEQIKLIVCVLAADIITRANRLRLPLTEKFIDELRLKVADAWITLRTWQSGKPIAGVTDATPNVVEMGALYGGPSIVDGGFGWGVGL
jgi:hypothetical protein